MTDIDRLNPRDLDPRDLDPRDLDPRDLDPRDTALVQVLGAIAYGEWKAYDGARSEAEVVDDSDERKVLKTIAAEELRHHKGFVRALEELGADPERAMRPFRAALDTYHGSESDDDIERAVWGYLGEGIADDLLQWLRRVVDAETATFVESVIADEEGHEARATENLRRLLAETPGGRRRAGIAARRMLLRMGRSGGASTGSIGLASFLRVGRPHELLGGIMRGWARRMRAVGLAPLGTPIPRLTDLRSR